MKCRWAAALYRKVRQSAAAHLLHYRGHQHQLSLARGARDPDQAISGINSCRLRHGPLASPSGHRPPLGSQGAPVQIARIPHDPPPVSGTSSDGAFAVDG